MGTAYLQGMLVGALSWKDNTPLVTFDTGPGGKLLDVVLAGPAAAKLSSGNRPSHVIAYGRVTARMQPDVSPVLLAESCLAIDPGQKQQLVVYAQSTTSLRPPPGFKGSVLRAYFNDAGAYSGLLLSLGLDAARVQNMGDRSGFISAGRVTGFTLGSNGGKPILEVSAESFVEVPATPGNKGSA